MGTKCEGMSRHVTRTYGRVKETSSSKAFDEILSEKINKPIAARATIHKWGKTSFTSVRGARETAFDLKRRRSEASKKANQDPFTFELEDGPSSPRKRRTQGSGVTSVVTPAIARQVLKEYRFTALARNESLKVDSADEDEEEDEDDVKFNPVKKPTKTYTRQPLCKPPPVLKAAEDSSENMAVSLPSEQSEPDTGDSMEPPKLFSQSSVISSEHSTPPVTTTETVEDTEQRLSDVSDEEVSFKQKTSKSFTSGVKTETENSSSASNAILSAADRESAYWEQRNKYQSKTVYKSPSKTPQNPSRQETLTIIRVSPPSWFKKSAENQKTDMADIELDIISKHTDLKLKYESHNFKKMQPASKDADTFDFVAESGKKTPLVRQPLPKRKFFKTRKQNVTSDENEADDKVKKEVKNEDYVPSEIESQLVAEIFGDDQSESSHSQHSGESVESEVNDSEPEMPKLSPAPQLMELEMAPDIATEVSDEAAETNGSQENPEPPVLKTYTRRRERPVRYSETSEPKKFFKSKSQSKVERLKAEESLQKKIFTSPKKSPSKAMYNPRTWRVEDEEEAGKPQKSAVVKKKAAPKPSVFDDDFDEDPVGDKPKVMRTVVWPKEAGDEAFTSLHVTREHKKLFTVVKNVKQAHECQEIGETQEFMDDIEYLLVGLLDSEPSSVRCLSCVSLATKCTMPSFRMHLRAHGIVAKVFSALHDAYTHSSLSLCTAAIMYMLSRDRLNMDLDRPSLDLLLKLLGVEQQDEGSTPSRASSAANKEYRRTRERIAEIILSMQGGSKQFDVETISTGNLAMESLLTLTSRRAGEVFKEELRSLGALDHIVDTVCHCAEMMEGGMEEELSDQGVEHFRKVERCLRVLEQVTYCNTDNQAHLISYKKASLISSVTKALSVCEQCLGGNPVAIKTDSLKVDKDCVGWAIYSCMLAILRVLLNLTHENEWGCTRIGEQEDFLNIVLLCTLKSPQFVPQDTRFDLLVLSLGTMINLVEHCDINRRRFISADTVTSFECGGSRREVSAVEAIIGLFKLREEAARRAETETLSPEKGKEGGDIDPANQSGAWEESATGLEWVVNPAQANKPAEKKAEETTAQNSQDDEEYFTKALHKAGKHMEDSIVASYIALLLGCVIQDNQEFVDKVKEHFEGGEFMPMIKILKKFLGFMNLTTAMTTTGGKSIARVIEILEAC